MVKSVHQIPFLRCGQYVNLVIAFWIRGGLNMSNKEIRNSVIKVLAVFILGSIAVMLVPMLFSI